MSETSSKYGIIVAVDGSAESDAASRREFAGMRSGSVSAVIPRSAADATSDKLTKVPTFVTSAAIAYRSQMIGCSCEITYLEVRPDWLSSADDSPGTEVNAMESSSKLQDRTRMFARVMGPYMAIIAAVVALRPDDMRAMLSKFEADPVLSFVTGVFTLLLGLVIIALHPYWRGGAAIIVSVVGWLFAVQGLVLVAGSHAYFAVASSAVDTMGWARAGAAAEVLIVLFLGLYLALVGWVPARTGPAAQPASSTPDVSRAA